MSPHDGKIRAAIVGAGPMAVWHAAAIRRTGGSIAAVIDAESGVAADFTRRHAKRAAGMVSLTAAAAQVALDVVHVCTPSSEHVAVVKQALDAGLHVLVEKPLAPGAAETEELLRAAAARGLMLCPVHQFVFQDGVRKAKQLLPSIAPLHQIGFRLHSAGGVGRSEDGLDRLLADLLPHPLSVLDYLVGEVDEVVMAIAHPAAGELHAAGERNGIAVSLVLSLGSRPTVNACEVVGQRGAVHADLFHGFGFRRGGGVSRARKVAQPFADSLRLVGAASANLGRRIARWEPAYPGLRSLIAAFYDGIRNGGAVPVSPESTLRVARARDALVDAIARHSRVDVDGEGRRS